MAPPKRKRPDRTYSQDDERNASRPSPHRPQSLPLAHNAHQQQSQHQHHPQHHSQQHPHQQPHQQQQYQQQQHHNQRGGGNAGRRQSRGGGRGGSSMPQSPNVSHASPTAMSPPTNTVHSRQSVQNGQTAHNPAPAVQSPSASQSHITRRVPESNEYLTPARVAHWNADARNAVVQTALSAHRDGDALMLAVVFHEIIEASMDHSLEASELGHMVRDIVAAGSTDLIDPTSTFLDTLSSLTQDEDKKIFAKELLDAKPLVVATDIPVERVRSELEEKVLRSFGLVRDSFPKMAVRKATQLLYRQMNYNLLREETEGYAKLMTEYFTTAHNEPPSQEVVNETYQRVNALIGVFDLDIGRVLDVTLDVFANLLIKHGKFFVKLLRSSAWWPELRGLEGLEWEEPDVSTLPDWANPESALWYYTEEEKEKQRQWRDQRDRKFWQRVGELGDRSGVQAFFELGSRRITADNRQPEQLKPIEGTQLSKQQAARNWGNEWMKLTKTLPPSGNDIAAQLLGFKLQCYASENRDPSDKLPENLIYLAALLIKIGFVSIMDLYPHLYPAEADMSAYKERLIQAKKEKERKERGVVVNALTMAGALPEEDPMGRPQPISRLREAESRSKPESDRSTPGKTDDATDSKSVLEEPADQKFQLLKSLLTIGALPESLFILGRHPWLLEVYPELIGLICRLAHHSLDKIYESAKPSGADQVQTSSKGAGSRGPTKPSDFVPRKTLRWGKPDQRHGGDDYDYKFYWEDWSDSVPVCHTVDDVFKLCNTLLGIVGPECGQDVVLLTKIIRIGRQSLAEDNSDANRTRWFNFSATFIAPALTFTGRNPGVVTEVWELFKQFDTATRYTIYQQWFAGNKPAVRAAFADVQTKTKHELSRISASNTKEYGRRIAKISYSAPGIVFKLTVKQLVAYPNMIDTLVECSRYLTLLGYDVLTWTLVTFFLHPDKGSTQDDGMLSAPWLRNIASFVGKAYQKYYLMNPVPILQFTASQLLQSEGELYMLDVLEQMIKSMGGITVGGSLSESMVLALASGPALRTHTLEHHLADKRHEAASSARRLVRCLRDTGLAPQLLIALAQHVEVYPHRADQQETPDKVVLFNVDKLRTNLVQYLELLRAYLTVDEFDALFPPVIDMIAEYGVEPDVAFTVARASITAKANDFRAQKGKSSLDTKVLSDGADRVAKEQTEDNVNGIDTPAAGKVEDQADDVEMADAPTSTQGDANDDKRPTNTAETYATSSVSDDLNLEIVKLADQLKASIQSFEQHPAVLFYVTFWQLSLSDVDNGGMNQQYREAIAYCERLIPGPHPERRGYRSAASKKDLEDIRKAKSLLPNLKKEQVLVVEANATTQEHLRGEMQRWFENIPMIGPQSEKLHSSLLQDCFIPRSRMTLQDAQYAAAMLMFMHKSGVPGFRTIKLLDYLFNLNKLTCIISMYTEDESRAFGRFLSEILRELQIWHADEINGYGRSGIGVNNELPGFGKRFDAEGKPIDHLPHGKFCLLLAKWHKQLQMALKTCIESGNWMQIRNSVNILKALHPTFPKIDVQGNELASIIKGLASSDARPDLQTSLLSILGDFNRSKKFWQTEHDFKKALIHSSLEIASANIGQLPPPPKTTNGTDKTADVESSKPPQAEEANTPKLKPTAPSFRPKAEINGARPVASTTAGDDGPNRAESTPATSASTTRDTGSTKTNLQAPEYRGSTPSRQEPISSRNITKPGPPMHPSSVPLRPDNRNAPVQSASVGRPSHALPSRPEYQPSRARQPDRPSAERPQEVPPHNRYDNRGPQSDYGRLDRPLDVPRHREASPGRRGRLPHEGRTPERLPSSVDHRDWSGRDPREYDDRPMRAPPRDVRPHASRPIPDWDARDDRELRDARDQRDRPDSRGHIAPSLGDSRRIAASPPTVPHVHPTPRRDLPTQHQMGLDRNDANRQSPATTTQPGSGPTVNPARAALINEEVLGGVPRIDRDTRRERGSRPQSPRRAEERHVEQRRPDDYRNEERANYGYAGRPEVPRDHRDDRMHSHGMPMNSRDHRDDMSGNTPSGPRGGRPEPSLGSRASREMFQPSQGPRPSGHQPQDPNYGRLNQPSDSVPPSGPRSERPQMQSQPLTPAAPYGPSAPPSGGIHPSRLENIQTRGPGGPPLQTSMYNAPSGPRGPGRTPQNTVPSSPIGRGPPTGPAGAMDRNPRNGGAPSRVANNAPAHGSPNDRIGERNVSQQGPPVRGRGASRANGQTDVPEGDSPMPPPQASTPNARGDSQYSRNSRPETPLGRVEGFPMDETRSDSRSHREGRRSERSGRERSSDHGERHPDERSSRIGSAQIEQERGSERDRGRDKRGDRESSRRDREREGGERANREAGREPREPRESGSRRERGPRDDGRLSSGRDDRERRSRGGHSSSGGAGPGAPGSDDGRKRARDSMDQSQGHPDAKRRR